MPGHKAVGAAPPRTPTRNPNVNSRALAAAILAVAALAHAILTPFQPRLVLNVSPSVPIGVYRLDPDLPRRGDFAVVRLPPHHRAFADTRLPRSFLLVKPVVAIAGDAVCRLGLSLWINGRRSVSVPIANRLGGPLLTWRGCQRLDPGEVFLLSTERGSYDSRYFGPIQTRYVIGKATPLLTFPIVASPPDTPNAL